jgi:hypothetical protein
LLGCAVVLPPTPIVQTPKIIQATSTVVVAANAQGNTPASGSVGPSASATSKTSSTSSDGDKSDKSDDKIDSKKEISTKDISEAKNEPAPPKLFCN